MSRLLILGIDALDSTFLSKYEGELVHLRQIKKESPGIKSRSTYPPDTPTAWASIYTGLNPAQHGMIYFLDPLEKVLIISYEDLPNDPIRDKTFWDIAGRAGKKVCILFPHLGYPVWPVNGVMVGKSLQRSGKVIPVQSYPQSLSEKYNLLPLGNIKSTPQRSLLPKFVEAHKKLVSTEAEFALRMWKEDNWDLFFFYSSSLDWVGHNLWSYFDENDPAYPGDNPYKNIHKEFYHLYDDIVGQFLAVAGPDTTIMVLSDHGQTMRPLKLLNINEILRREGLLVPKIKKADFRDPYYAIEAVRSSVTRFVNKFGIGGIAMKIMHAIPRIRKMYTAPLAIDWQNTVAYVSDLSGIKAYPYGGITINKEKLKDRDYEELRTHLIHELSELKGADGGGCPVEFVCRREEVYQGEYITRYPDVVFQLRDDYGAGWAIYGSVFGESQTHNIQPGSHKLDTPVFLLSNLKGKEPLRKRITLMDIAPTVLHLLGVDAPLNIDGRSIFEE